MISLDAALLPQELDLTAHNRDERFAAAFLGTKTETLRTWRKKGIGPPWRKINGKLIRYSLAELIAWVKSQPGGGQAAYQHAQYPELGHEPFNADREVLADAWKEK